MLQVEFNISEPGFTLGDLLKLGAYCSASLLSRSLDCLPHLTPSLWPAELHKYEEEVAEIVDRSQKEEKLEQVSWCTLGLQFPGLVLPHPQSPTPSFCLQALGRLEETWGKAEFVFTTHRTGDVSTVKMAEEDFDALEDNQVLVQVCGCVR